jgi:hypothetical protein
MNQRNLVPGLILIGLGVFLAIVELTGVGAEAVVAVIGGAFLVAYAVTRHYGLLIAGGIMTGLGLGIVWETQVFESGAAVLIGLGAGFLSVYLIDLLVRHSTARWWPVIPGGLLVTIGVFVGLEERALVGAEQVWPVILIVIGALLLITQLLGRTGSAPRGDDHEPSLHAG